MRKRFGLFVFATTAIAAASSPVAAQWQYDGDESAFSGTGTHFAMAATISSAFGLRCADGKVEAVYITPENMTSEEAARIALLPVNLLVRVDENPIEELDAEIDSANGTMRLTGAAGLGLVEQVRDAKGRVAVAMDLGGTNFHEQNFRASGSTRAAERLIEACNLTE